jgi:hypothetical protein
MLCPSLWRAMSRAFDDKFFHAILPAVRLDKDCVMVRATHPCDKWKGEDSLLVCLERDIQDDIPLTATINILLDVTLCGLYTVLSIHYMRAHAVDHLAVKLVLELIQNVGNLKSWC